MKTVENKRKKNKEKVKQRKKRRKRQEIREWIYNSANDDYWCGVFKVELDKCNGADAGEPIEEEQKQIERQEE